MTKYLAARKSSTRRIKRGGRKLLKSNNRKKRRGAGSLKSSKSNSDRMNDYLQWFYLSKTLKSYLKVVLMINVKRLRVKEGRAGSLVKSGVPEMLTLIVLNLWYDSVSLDVHFILLNPGLPVFPLSISRHLFFMLTNHISPFLIGKIVRDFTPDFDLLNPLRCGMRCLI